MKFLFVALFVFLYAAQGIPSKGVTHDAPAHSMKDDLSQDTFIGEISDDSFGTYGGADPKIEAVGYGHEHTYEDFNADVGRYPEYEQFRSFEGFEDVIPRDVRVSGLSIEDEQKFHYADTKHSDTTEDKQSTSQDLHNTERDSENLNASAGLEEDLDLPGEEFEDVTVEGLSDYSYLIGDKLHGVNEFRTAGVINRAHKLTSDVEDSEEFQDFGYVEEQDEDLNYDQFLENEDREVQDDEYDHEYDHADDVTIRGQAAEGEGDEESDEDDFEEGEELDDSDYDDDQDYYDEDEDESEEIDAGVDTTIDTGDDSDFGEDDGDEFDEDGEDDFTARDVEQNEIDAKVKGMAVRLLKEEEYDEDDEEFDDEDDDEYEDDLPETGRPYEEEEDGDEEEDEEDEEDEDGGDYVDDFDEDYEGDENWDEEEDDFDSTSREVELAEGIPQADEKDASESLHGDDIRPGITTEKRK